MNQLPIATRLAVCCCLTLFVFLAAAQPTFGLLFVLLLPFWFFVEFVVVALAPAVNEGCAAPKFPALPVFSPRPPPVL